ncbi:MULTISPECIES: accessory Sec system protein Asp1 [unclassified Streptococcus]|uniref:accessory Sec system protein Asp1 n=1 Tax=unclassified Streptococcus TaxID=2608887 RepID=UPI001071EB76|nr:MULTISPECIES: accessory Sec system protein Asp1 [unclassified Streptococcus]MBF0787143.1 accessory Sec system protein Asp1 [Streptococcus sp. 19428wC2_LYSM12]MCQ9212140.1 accessory Sec system protein Asp1 [Streptococcus sp. B01]MCQ9213469.1 accessory Sec system protein Asp1 [Streptococcus sp. O1]TFV05900.1 accessory Sec system protein Asp1 [Streptococcus sp. LYSM12]
MFYFIPAWYNQQRPWYDNTPLWFRVFERMTFDDTVNQLKMFQNTQEPSSLLILNYQPQLRYFLHKQDLLGVDYWSFFDDVQNISAQSVKPISFKKLQWPKGTRFLYSPFAVVAKKAETVVAYIHFAENGNLLSVDFQKEGRSDKQYFFDDRGFLSSILYHQEDGSKSHQDYLNQNGVWQVREHLSDERSDIEINLFSDHTFQKYLYQNWEELLSERLAALKQKQMTSSDVVIIASHTQHNELLLKSFSEQKKVFSFFADRYDVSNLPLLSSVVQAADLLVVDTEKEEKRLLESLQIIQKEEKALTRISPFDTRLRLGHSQMVKELTIYFYIDTIGQDLLEANLLSLLDMMDQNPLIELKVVTFNHQFSLSQLKDWVCRQIESLFEQEHFFTLVEDAGENHLDEDQELELSRIEFDCFSNENQIIEALDTARLVLDLGEEPDLYTQIASISAGIPQIHRVETDYVSHKKNGWVLEGPNDLQAAIHYYFDGLSNWNASLVYAIQKMADYTSGRILAQWKELLEKD